MTALLEEIIPPPSLPTSEDGDDDDKEPVIVISRSIAKPIGCTIALPHNRIRFCGLDDVDAEIIRQSYETGQLVEVVTTDVNAFERIWKKFGRVLIERVTVVYSMGGMSYAPSIYQGIRQTHMRQTRFIPVATMATDGCTKIRL